MNNQTRYLMNNQTRYLRSIWGCRAWGQVSLVQFFVLSQVPLTLLLAYVSPWAIHPHATLAAALIPN